MAVVSPETSHRGLRLSRWNVAARQGSKRPSSDVPYMGEADGGYAANAVNDANNEEKTRM